MRPSRALLAGEGRSREARSATRTCYIDWPGGSAAGRTARRGVQAASLAGGAPAAAARACAAAGGHTAARRPMARAGGSRRTGRAPLPHAARPACPSDPMWCLPPAGTAAAHSAAGESTVAGAHNPFRSNRAPAARAAAVKRTARCIAAGAKEAPAAAAAGLAVMTTTAAVDETATRCLGDSTTLPLLGSWT
eukprot:scaffold13708_cov116-Isochrysis_galbana.AAC.7